MSQPAKPRSNGILLGSLLLLLLLLGSVASASGCGGVATDQAVCEADETRECQPNRRCIGVQTCIDGIGWGECLCADSPARGGSGGSGASNFGGTSNQGGGPPGRGGTTGRSCDADECSPWNGTFFLDFPACCSDDSCGVDLSNAQGSLLISGCREVDRPGRADPTCPEVTVYMIGTEVDFAGCCDTNGQCGFQINLTTALDPRGPLGQNLGCQPREAIGEQPIRCN